ncbi:hypothetical protein [Nannocystis bainbridge]|uniref:Uncharacterized protein n=1 Tax=Nannocystis bainbridge TaxID=2995303 RepID=A0ABT5E9L4_9BACT|nr:hypothetical protein [Nannocystis bainbridge]MDC0721562.1 hypothetical protein [Nannocystis bainbridge]
MWYCKWDPEETNIDLQTEMREMCFYYMKTADMADSAKRAAALADTNQRKCWQVDQFPCGQGTATEAATACSMDCVSQRETAIDGLYNDESVIPEAVGEAHDTWDCLPVSTFEDTVYPAPEGKNDCAFIAPVWDGSSPSKTFHATLSLTGFDGGSSSQTNVTGYLAVRTENCDTVQCDLVITAIEGSQRNFTGVYTLPSGAQTSYALQNADFQLTEELRGQWRFARGTVTFPTDDAVLRAWASGLSLNGFPSGDVDFFTQVTIEQLSGSYRNGVLSLMLNYQAEGSLLAVSLQTN